VANIMYRYVLSQFAFYLFMTLIDKNKASKIQKARRDFPLAL